MFYEVEIEDIVRVSPEVLKEEVDEAIYNMLRSLYIGAIKKNYGIIVTIKDIISVEGGMLVPEDGGVYYKVKFTAILYRPELNELSYGIVSTITDFGAFVSLGPIDGLVHISQIMDDEVSISGREAIIGKKSRKVLKVGDIVKARVISVSYKDPTTIRVALTMRQVGLGKLEWLEQEKKQSKSK